MTRVDLEVLVAGSLHLDIVVEAQHLPIIDETARGSAWRMVCGGKGGNQACWAARLGARTAMISQLGEDDFGRRLMANLQSCGVLTAGVSIDPRTGSGMSVAILNASGDYGAVIVSGANLTLRAGEVRQRLAALGSPRILVLQNEIEEDVNVAVAVAARSAGARVLLNAAPARVLGAEFAALVDVLIVNRVEAEMMCGQACTSTAGADAAARLLRLSFANVIVTLGGQGLVVAAEGQEPVWIAPVPVTVVSTHGAGDCFVGQLAAAMAKGMDLQAAAEAANRTAALYVSGQLAARPA
jgi:ribokinase